MRHVLGVDAGGSKILAAVADETGRVLAIGRAGGASHQIIGIEAALREIKKASQEAIERSSLTAPPDFAVFGIASADLPQDFELLASALADLGFARKDTGGKRHVHCAACWGPKRLGSGVSVGGGLQCRGTCPRRPFLSAARAGMDFRGLGWGMEHCSGRGASRGSCLGRSW